MMKKYILVVFLLSVLGVQAQHKSSVETRALMQEFSRTKSANAAMKLFEGQLAIQNDAKGVCTVRAMAKLAPGVSGSQIEKSGIKVTSQVADIVALRLPLDKLYLLEESPLVLQYTVCHKAQMHVDNGRMDTHADSVQAGYGLPQSFKGDGVLVGICDWGFDYRHPNINSKDEKRIFAAWDQFKTSGPAPEGFDYGTVHMGYDALVEAMVDTSNIYQYNSHGTHCAGIIGGRGTRKEGNSQAKFIGIAPHVQYLLGSWLLDEASWMDQVTWMYGVAKREQKRLVISNSWGMYSFSCLDGTSLASQMINHYADSGVVFVTSAGNNGRDNCHLSMTFGNNDTVKSLASYYTGNGGQMIICWGNPGEQFQVGFGLTDYYHNDQLARGPFFSTSDNIDYQEGYVVIGNDTVHWNVMTESCNPFNQRPHALLKVDRANQVRLHTFFTADSGASLQAWNVNYLKEHESNIGMDFYNTGFPGYREGDYYCAIGEPACAEKSIAVAAHAAGTWKNDSTWVPGMIASFSSYGPLMDGRIKPDISAPGVNVTSSVSSWDSSQQQFEGSTSDGGRSYKWAKMSGTSMSGPMVAGVAVLMLEANPHLTVDELKEIIGRTATNDKETGVLVANDSVSIRWGHGKINAYRCVCGALDKLSVEEVKALSLPLEVYPNPAVGNFTVLTNTDMDCTVEVFGMDGRIITTQTAHHGVAQINTQNWSNGVYVVRCSDRSGVRTSKVVVQ